MRRLAAGVLVAALTGWLAAPVTLEAWGLEVHRLITRRAIEGLPAALKPYYLSRAAFFAEHSVDPDLWRVVGLKSDRGDEDPNHFLDIDGLDEPRPFTNVPRGWDQYVARYGVERATKMGRLPWRAEELYGRLVSVFRDVAKGQGYAAENAVFLSAVLAHYIEDAHVPFHAVANYDGQATNQRGIHSRFESQLVMRNQATLKLASVTVHPVPDIKAFVFETLIEGEALVQSVLAADLAAAKGREFYDDAYFAAFLKGARPVMERRLAEAASGVASVIVAAWTEAGKPAMPTGAPAQPARIRR